MFVRLASIIKTNLSNNIGLLALSAVWKAFENISSVTVRHQAFLQEVLTGEESQGSQLCACVAHHLSMDSSFKKTGPRYLFLFLTVSGTSELSGISLLQFLFSKGIFLCAIKSVYILRVKYYLYGELHGCLWTPKNFCMISYTSILSYYFVTQLSHLYFFAISLPTDLKLFSRKDFPPLLFISNRKGVRVAQ